MIIINKKRIKIILSCILIGIFAFSFQVVSNKNEFKKSNNLSLQNTIQTTATPVSGKTVVIDAGHGAPDEGGSLLHQVKNRSNYFFIKNNCRCKSLQFF